MTDAEILVEIQQISGLGVRGLGFDPLSSHFRVLKAFWLAHGVKGAVKGELSLYETLVSCPESCFMPKKRDIRFWLVLQHALHEAFIF